MSRLQLTPTPPSFPTPFPSILVAILVDQVTESPGPSHSSNTWTTRNVGVFIMTRATVPIIITIKDYFVATVVESSKDIDFPNHLFAIVSLERLGKE